jgi:hypothetical protein
LQHYLSNHLTKQGVTMAIRSLKTGTFSRSLLVGNLPYILRATELEYLVVAGGGAAGYGQYAQGGGGAGGYRTATGYSVTPGTTYTVTVGAGGASDVSGSNSVFDTITSTGGGRGGGLTQHGAASGGSGGGGVEGYTAGGAGTSGQGFAGGTQGGSSWVSQGGGGGADAAGTANTTSNSTGAAGSGGNGKSSSITGTATYYAGGGGAGAWGGSLTSGPGGLGGGGNGTSYPTNGQGTNGTANTGGGGGGGANGGLFDGASGGSGIVVLRHPDTFPQARFITGGVTVTQTGGYYVYKFTSSGSINI